jgi:predicted HTH domain antitoxin
MLTDGACDLGVPSIIIVELKNFSEKVTLAEAANIAKLSLWEFSDLINNLKLNGLDLKRKK